MRDPPAAPYRDPVEPPPNDPPDKPLRDPDPPPYRDPPAPPASHRRRRMAAGAAIRNRGRDDRYSFTVRNRSALPTTLTDDSAIAAAAMTGESSMPNTG